MVHNRVVGGIAVRLASIDQVALDLGVRNARDLFRVTENPDGLHAYKYRWS